MPVNSTDGEFGELVDIIVDPAKRSTTHVIVKPYKKHYQARLVPIWLVSSEDGVLNIDLDLRHIRQLQRVSTNEFVPVVGEVDLASKWDVAAQPLKKLPLWDIRTLRPSADRDEWYPIPEGECEIRRNSKVVGSKGRTLGSVDGFISAEDQIVAVVVETGVSLFRQCFVVPVDLVERVSDGLIELSINRLEFEELERFDHLEDNGPVATKVARKVSRVNAKLGSRIFMMLLVVVIAGCSESDAVTPANAPTTQVSSTVETSTTIDGTAALRSARAAVLIDFARAWESADWTTVGRLASDQAVAVAQEWYEESMNVLIDSDNVDSVLDGCSPVGAGDLSCEILVGPPTGFGLIFTLDLGAADSPQVTQLQFSGDAG